MTIVEFHPHASRLGRNMDRPAVRLFSDPGLGIPKNMEIKGYIYFMTNSSNRVLYIGMTNSLKRRIAEHAAGHSSAFTHK